jgi:Skp family chaperone for outer membrane proteins
VLNVTKPRFVAAVGGVLVVLSLAVLTASAQRPGGNAASQSGIALLDVNRVFKNHGRFQQMMADMKTDLQAEEEMVRKEKEAITGEVEVLKSIKTGTPDYKEREQRVATRQADLNVRLQLKRKEFLLREAKMYNAVYQEVEQEVRYYASQMGIAMVLRYNGDTVDPDNPEDVLRNISKPVVCFAPGMDITDVIIQQLNIRGGGGGGAQNNNNSMSRRPTGVPYPPR